MSEFILLNFMIATCSVKGASGLFVEKVRHQRKNRLKRKMGERERSMKRKWESKQMNQIEIE